MRSFRISQLLACVFTVCLGGVSAHANPIDGVVSDGQATITTSGTTLNVNQSSDRAVIDWRSFNIDPGETTAFHQPSSSSLTLNRVNSADPSQILGTLTANGHVILINPNGVFFGKGSRVDVGGLTATTANIRNNDFMSGHMNFDQPGRDDASIVNEGSITVHDGGLVNLAGPNVENHGVITATLGKINMASGEKFTIDMANDGLIKVALDKDSLPGQTIANTGTLSANGGQINMTAAAARDIVDSLISNTGVIEAKTIGDHKGNVTLSAEGSNAVARNITANKKIKQGRSAAVNSGTIDVSGLNAGESGGSVSLLADTVWVEGGSRINASGTNGGGTVKIGGDFHGEGDTPTAATTYVAKNTSITADAIDQGSGGDVTIWADGTTNFYGDISAKGGAASGNGGFVEVSGRDTLNFHGTVNTRANNGNTGMLLLDPANITVADGTGDGGADGNATFSGSGTAGTVASGDASPSTIYESELEGIAAGTSISIAASNAITINALTDGNLNLKQTAGKTVTFTAGAGGITMANTANTITTAGGNLNFVTTGGTSALGNLTTGGGTLTLNLGGTASLANLSTSGGAITFTGAGTSTVSGVISGTGTSVTQNGIGTVTLSGANTFTGGASLNATGGTLVAGNDSAFGTGTLSLGAGTFQGNGVAHSFSNDVLITATTTIGGTSALNFTGNTINNVSLTLTNNNSGGVAFGNFALSPNGTNRSLTFAGTGNTTINGVLSNGSTSTSSIIMSGSGVLALNGANTYSGDTLISGGTITVGNNSALGTGAIKPNGGTLQGDGTARTLANTVAVVGANSVIGGSSDLTFTGLVGMSISATNHTLTVSNSANTYFNNTMSGAVLGGTATAGGLIKSGTGTLFINAASTGMGGGVTVNGGTLKYGIANALSGVNITVGDGGTFDLNDFSDTIGSLTVNSGTTGGTAKTGTGTLTLGGNITSTGGASNALISGKINLGASRQINATNAADGITVSAVIAGAGFGVTKGGSGTVTLTGANTYSGGTTLSTGTIVAGSSSAFGTGTTTLGGAALQGTGSALTFTNNFAIGANTTIQGSTDLSFSGQVTNVTAAHTLTVNNSGATTFNNIALSNSGTSLGLTFTGTGNTTVNGVISNGSTSTAGTLTKAAGSTGTLTLNGSNTFGGGASLNGGTVIAGNDAAFGTGTLTLKGSTLQAGGAARSFSNAVSLAAGSSFAGTLGITFTGAALGTTGVTMTNNGTGMVTFGDVGISSAAGNRALSFAGTGDFTVSGVISNNASNGSINKSNSGLLILTGANTYTNGTVASAGTLQVGNDSALGTGTLTLSGSTLQGYGAAHSFSNAVAMTADSTISGTQDLTLGGMVSLSNSATNYTLNLAGPANTTINGIISNGSSAASNVSVTGGGTAALTAANTYSGTTTLTGGTLKIGNNAALGTSTLSLNGGTLRGDGTARTLTNAMSLTANTAIGGASDLTLNGTLNLTGNATLSNGNTGATTLGAITLSGYALTLAGAGNTTIGGSISSPTGSLVKQGAGILTISAANTYGGDTTINTGTLRYATNNALGSGNVIVNDGGTYDLSGFSDTIGALTVNSGATGGSVTTGSGTLTLGGDITSTGGAANANIAGNLALGASRTVTLTNAADGLTIAANISGVSQGLTKAGAGTLMLSGNNTYTGNTAVTAGTLRLGAADRIADASDVSVSAGATFDFNGFNETVYGITAAGDVAFGTGNTVTSTSTQAYNGKITGGDVSLVSTGGNITATNAQNDITGDLSLNASGSANIVDVNALKLGAVSAGTLTAFAKGGNLTLDGNIQTSGTSGTSLLLSTTGNFINSGSYTLQTGVGGRWLVYSISPLSNSNGGLAAAFKQYNATYGDTVLGSGNGFVYTLAPIVTAGLTGTVTKTYDGATAATLAAGHYSVANAVDGDTVTLNNPASGAYDNANAGTGRTVTVSGISLSGVTNGAAAVYGYQLASSTASAAVGTIDKANLTVTTSDVTKVYDGTVTANGTAIISSGMLYTNASNGNVTDSLTGGSYSFATPAIGTGKVVLVGGVSVNDGNGGHNYNLVYANNTHSSIIRDPSAAVTTPTQTVNDVIASVNYSRSPFILPQSDKITAKNAIILNSMVEIAPVTSIFEVEPVISYDHVFLSSDDR